MKVSEINNHKYKHLQKGAMPKCSMMYSDWSVVLAHQRPSSCFIRGVHSQMCAPCSHLMHPLPHLTLLHLSKAEIMWQGFINLFRSQASFAQQRPQSSIWHWFLLIYVEQAVLGVHVHWARCPSSLLCLQWQWYRPWWNMGANQHN